MKIISKTYLLIGVLIIVAFFNSFVLYNTQVTTVNESYSIIRAGDIKTKIETIASLAGSIANGKESDKPVLIQEVKDVDMMLTTLKSGGEIRGQTIATVPVNVKQNYDEVSKNWDKYKAQALEIQTSSIYDKDVVNALNYILGKNTELILTSDSVARDLEVLDRNYNRHREIAADLRETAKSIGQSTLLISLGQENEGKASLQKARIQFDVGLRNLLQEPLDGLDLSGLNVRAENLTPIPRENSQSLNDLDMLWEAVELRIKTLESKSLYSEGFDNPYSNLNSQRPAMLDSIDKMLDTWNQDRVERRSQGLVITQAIVGIDIGIFVVVLFTIRKSLTPLERITKALSRVKEGAYGEKIEYSSKDEIGDLASSFNTMTETIRTKEEEAKKIDTAKDEFLAMITHELKTPLVPIRGYADILLSGHLGNLTDKQKERISIIKSSAASLLQLISDLLDVQKLELGQLKLQIEPADIQETVASSIQTLQPQIEEDRISISNEVGKITIPHDSTRINQVLTNLIKNSLKAVTPQSGKIRIYSAEDQNEIRITIEDNGTGIPYDKQGKLFTKFYQADATLTREKGGSGLGLSICKGIIEAHGGKISLKSSPNTGTTVVFSLPKTPQSKRAI